MKIYVTLSEDLWFAQNLHLSHAEILFKDEASPGLLTCFAKSGLLESISYLKFGRRKNKIKHFTISKDTGGGHYLHDWDESLGTHTPAGM